MSQKANDLYLTRVIDAPRTLVFRMWTSSRHVANWWGPHGFTNPVCEWPARPGSKIRVLMRGPDGTVYPMGGEFHEVVEPEWMVFTTTALDDRGLTLLDELNTVTFEEEQGRTKLTVHAATVLSSLEGDRMLQGIEEGWKQSLERLAAHVKSEVGVSVGDRLNRGRRHREAGGTEV